MEEIHAILFIAKQIDLDLLHEVFYLKLPLIQEDFRYFTGKSDTYCVIRGFVSFVSS